MTLLPDHWIRERALADGMIEPFVDAQKKEGTISFGLSSFGYEARVSDEFLKGDSPPEVSHADRAGEYMGQRGVTPPRL